jgi:hypothetical protein
MTTTRDVLLRIKVQMEGARGSKIDYKQFATDQQKVTREVKAATAPLERQATLWERIARSTEKVAKSTKEIGQGAGRLPGGGSNAVGMSVGGGSGGGIGGMGMMGFGPKGMLAAGALATGRQVLNFGANEWGARLHGGPMQKGSMGWLEDLDDLFRGNKYRDAKEDRELADLSHHLKLREAKFQAGHRADLERDELAMGGMSPFATSRERLQMLKQRNNWPVQSWRDQVGGLTRQADTLAARQAGITGEYRRFIGEGKVPGFFSSSTTAGDPTGRLKTKFDSLEEQRKGTLVEQLKVNEQITQSMREQVSVTQAVQNNLKAQEATTKEMVVARRQSLTSFGMLDPFQQRSALGVATALKEGRSITREQQAVGMQVPEIADYMQRQAASRAINDPSYQKILELVGRPQDAQQFAKSKELTAGVKLQPGQTKIDVFVQVDEQVLAESIRRELRDSVREVEVLLKNLATQVAEGERMRMRMVQDRGALFGNSVPGG